MTVDIKTLRVEPRRHTFGHIARRFGADKPASRYEEGTLDVQATDHFHYRPLWDQEREIYDERRTAVKMKDWYALRDPRQYYYATYNIARAGMYQAVEQSFSFIERRDLLAGMDAGWRAKVEAYLIPLRHLEWGANMNAAQITQAGYGTAVTSASIFTAADRLGIAQTLSRIGLLLDGGTGASLDRGKVLWMSAPFWQEARRLVEDTLVIADWFELFTTQNLCLDGLLYPLVYEHFDAAGQRRGGAAVSRLTEFMVEWQAEHARWVDAVIKVAAAESGENRAVISGFYAAWRGRSAKALAPLAEEILGAEGASAVAAAERALDRRATGLGLAV